jgi:hypothetical protein
MRTGNNPGKFTKLVENPNSEPFRFCVDLKDNS